MMSYMTDWDENDITRWPEDDDPESLANGDAEDVQEDSWDAFYSTEGDEHV